MPTTESDPSNENTEPDENKGATNQEGHQGGEITVTAKELVPPARGDAAHCKYQKSENGPWPNRIIAGAAVVGVLGAIWSVWLLNETLRATSDAAIAAKISAEAARRQLEYLEKKDLPSIIVTNVAYPSTLVSDTQISFEIELTNIGGGPALNVLVEFYTAFRSAACATKLTQPYQPCEPSAITWTDWGLNQFGSDDFPGIDVRQKASTTATIKWLNQGAVDEIVSGRREFGVMGKITSFGVDSPTPIVSRFCILYYRENQDRAGRLAGFARAPTAASCSNDK